MDKLENEELEDLRRYGFLDDMLDEVVEIENSSTELDRETAIRLYNLYDAMSEKLKKVQQRISANWDHHGD